MTTRKDLIDDIAGDIAEGYSNGKFDAAYFLDSLMDDRQVEAHHVAILLNGGHAEYDVEKRIREMVKAAAVSFFSEDDRGIDYISDRLAEIEADAERAA